MSRRTTDALRSMSVADLGLSEYLPPDAVADFTSPFLVEPLDESDPILVNVRNALRDGFAGVIFVGPPGTSKSYYAARAGMALVERDKSRLRFVQFHPSFQYEDFVEGYIPQSSGEFELTLKHFGKMCEDAALKPNKAHVLVIDEISRCDAARVFGEALTYLETSKRSISFFLSSGTEMSVPPNVIILATMNPWDRGVDDMDVALERRFAYLDMPPSPEILRKLLLENGLPQNRIDGVVKFFEAIQKLPNAMCHIGHAYFVRVKDDDTLARLWQFQLKHHFTRACHQDPEEIKKIENMWSQLVLPPSRPIAEDKPDSTDSEQIPVGSR